MLAKREPQHHTSTGQPGSFTCRIRHTLKAWFSQFSFTSLSSSWLSLCVLIAFLPWNVTTRGHETWIDWNWRWNWCQLQCVVGITQFVFVDHSLSLLWCMTAPCRHSRHTANQRRRSQEDFISQTEASYHMTNVCASHAHSCCNEGGSTKPWHTLFRLIWGDVLCLVSSHLQSFSVCLFVVAWPLHSLVSTSCSLTLELVSKSRFNLHASCLQEEEVEEFRVSLSWLPVSSCFGLDQQKSDTPCIPTNHACPPSFTLSECTCASACASVWLTLPFAVAIHMNHTEVHHWPINCLPCSWVLCLSHIVAWKK